MDLVILYPKPYSIYLRGTILGTLGSIAHMMTRLMLALIALT